jgi:glycosyltransferase involved in cell wall biosynthesis
MMAAALGRNPWSDRQAQDSESHAPQAVTLWSGSRDHPFSAMRIALISNSLPPEDGTGGAQAYVADLAVSLADRHDVLVLSGARATELPSVETIRLPGLRRLFPTEPGLTKAAWHLRDQWMPSMHMAVRRHLRSFRPDVVHTHEPQGLSAAPFSAIARAGTAHVHTVHDLNLLCVRVTMTRGSEPCSGSEIDCWLQRAVRIPLLKKQLQRLISPSDYYRELHVRRGIVTAEHAVTIRQGAKPGCARQRNFSDSPCVGMLGALAPHKGLRTLLRAFASAPASWRLQVAGSGPEEHEVASAAAADSRIAFYGSVDGTEKEAFLDRLDALVIPSEWEENAPLVAAEAAVRGIPAVVSDRGGLPEIPEAEVFAARDPRSLRNAIAALVEPGGRLAEASALLLTNRQSFLWDGHVRQVERVLEAAHREVRGCSRPAAHSAVPSS